MDLKKTLTVFFILAVFWPVLSHANSCKQVIVTAHPEYPPYHWKDGNQIVGATIDIMRKILSEKDIKLDARYFGPWKRVLKLAERNQFDMILGLKETEERKRFLEFTTSPILPNPFAVFVKQGKMFEFNNWESLKLRKGGKNSGDRFGVEFDRFADENLNMEESYSTNQNVSKLLNHRIDFFIHGRYVGLAHIKRIKNGNLIVPLPNNINEGYIHSGFTLKSDCRFLNEFISNRYTEMLNSGEAMDILSKNINRWAVFEKKSVRQ